MFKSFERGITAKWLHHNQAWQNMYILAEYYGRPSNLALIKDNAKTGTEPLNM